jgi:hypothetical protein
MQGIDTFTDNEEFVKQMRIRNYQQQGPIGCTDAFTVVGVFLFEIKWSISGVKEERLAPLPQVLS